MLRKLTLRTTLIVAVLLLAAIMAAGAASAESLLQAKAVNELRQGMSGSQVNQYQDRLIHYGYLNSASGVFDNGTILATRYFQHANKLAPNGIATAKTQTMIKKDSGVVDFAAYEKAQTTSGFKAGAFGLGVAMVQERLKELGYFKGDVSGKCGSGTASAIVTFKKFNYPKNATSTMSGADRAFLASEEALSYGAVYGPDTIKPGDKGEGVEDAQSILCGLGYYSGKINGKYGKEMFQAVQKMQRAYKLYPTGWLYSPSMAILEKNNEKGLVNARALSIANLATSLLNRKYKLGEDGPNTFDCSGFTRFVYGEKDINLPHNAASQSKVGTLISKRSIAIGDLVFFATGKSTTKVNHVGIVCKKNATNTWFVHASSAKGKVIISTFIDKNKGNFYNTRFRWARRMA